MDAAARKANANSKVLRIEHIVNERTMASPDQMDVIGRIVDEYREETASAAKDVLIGGPYNRTVVAAGLPDVVLIGPDHARYVVVRDPGSRARLGGYVYAPREPQ